MKKDILQPRFALTIIKLKRQMKLKVSIVLALHCEQQIHLANSLCVQSILSVKWQNSNNNNNNSVCKCVAPGAVQGLVPGTQKYASLCSLPLGPVHTALFLPTIGSQKVGHARTHLLPLTSKLESEDKLSSFGKTWILVYCAFCL